MYLPRTPIRFVKYLLLRLAGTLQPSRSRTRMMNNKDPIRLASERNSVFFPLRVAVKVFFFAI